VSDLYFLFYFKKSKKNVKKHIYGKISLVKYYVKIKVLIIKGKYL